MTYVIRKDTEDMRGSRTYTRAYYHPHIGRWRATPPLPGHRFSREETARIAAEVGGRVVHFVTRRERVVRLAEAARAAVEVLSHDRAYDDGEAQDALERALRAFL